MEKVVDALRAHSPHERRQLLAARSPHPGYRPEMAEQGLDALGADSLDLLQFAADEVRAPLLAMERDAETVRLVAQVANHLQRLARAAEVVGHRIVRIEDLLDALGESHDGHPILDAQLTQHGIGARQLPLAAIDHDQVGQFGPFVEQTAVAAPHDFAHRREVVGPHHRLDIEVAILLARGLAVAEHDARRHGVRALEVRVVEALDVTRLPVEAQFAAHGLHQPLGVAFGIADFEVAELLRAVDAGAALRKGEQVELLAPLGHGEGRTVEQHRRRGQKGHHDLARLPPATRSTMCWMASVSISARSVSTPGESFTVYTPTIEPWRMRTKLQ